VRLIKASNDLAELFINVFVCTRCEVHHFVCRGCLQQEEHMADSKVINKQRGSLQQFRARMSRARKGDSAPLLCALTPLYMDIMT